MKKIKEQPMTPAMLRAAAEGMSLLAGTPGAIEASERQGQADLVKHADRLPLDLHPERTVWEELGFRFGDKIDEVFQEATLPDGWKIVATGHSMHSDIVDSKGNVRGSLFYKAAFYDRRANAGLCTRYMAGTVYDCEKAGSHLPKESYVYAVVDRITGIVKTFGEPISQDNDPGWEAEDALDDKARAWLAENYPNHENPAAYWP